MKTIEGISELQEERRKYDPTTAAQIDAYLVKLEEYKDGKHFPFEMVLEDPSGNSFISNPNAPSKDTYMKTRFFKRSTDDIKLMGFNVEEAIAEQGITN